MRPTSKSVRGRLDHATAREDRSQVARHRSAYLALRVRNGQLAPSTLVPLEAYASRCSRGAWVHPFRQRANLWLRADGAGVSATSGSRAQPDRRNQGRALSAGRLGADLDRGSCPEVSWEAL